MCNQQEGAGVKALAVNTAYQFRQYSLHRCLLSAAQCMLVELQRHFAAALRCVTSHDELDSLSLRRLSQARRCGGLCGRRCSQRRPEGWLGQVRAAGDASC